MSDHTTTITKTAGLPPDGADGLFLGWLGDGRTVLLKWVSTFDDPGWIGITWDSDTPTSRPIVYRLDEKHASPPYAVVEHARLL